MRGERGVCSGWGARGGRHWLLALLKCPRAMRSSSRFPEPARAPTKRADGGGAGGGLPHAPEREHGAVQAARRARAHGRQLGRERCTLHAGRAAAAPRVRIMYVLQPDRALCVLRRSPGGDVTLQVLLTPDKSRRLRRALMILPSIVIVLFPVATFSAMFMQV